MDWGDSVRLNISVPTDPAYANIVPHIVSPDIQNLEENSYATTFGLDTDGDFVVDQSFGMQLNSQGHMQLYLRASSHGVNNAGNEVLKIRRGNRCKRKLAGWKRSKCISMYVVENVSGVVEMQKIDMPAIPFQVASYYNNWGAKTVRLQDESGFAVLNPTSNNKMLVTNIIESDSGVYEVRDSYVMDNNVSSYSVVAADQNGVYFSSWSTGDDLLYTDGSQTVTIFDAVNPSDGGYSYDVNYQYSISDGGLDSGPKLTVAINDWDNTKREVLYTTLSSPQTMV